MPSTLQAAVSRKWFFQDHDRTSEQNLVDELRIHPLTARLMTNRGLTDLETANRFLHPSLRDLHDPFLLPDMDRAARRIADAVGSGETLFIHGDYDVDGVTSTALYVRSLQVLKARVLHRVPHRHNDGYDLKPRAIDWAHGQGATLLITTDCGIQAREAVEHANALGMTVIVTDHHEPGETLPPAYAVVNPHRADSKYPFPQIAGVAVAFKTMQAVFRLVQPEWESAFIDKFLDLVACGTVADVMPLRDENRIFARFGLVKLAETKKVGLRALLEGSGIDCSRKIRARSVGFGIGPRINAVGRLDDAAIALDLMLTSDLDEARRLVDRLNQFNLERKQAQREMLDQARAQVAEADLDSVRVLVLASEKWNPGVVGIVAGRLVELYHRPAIVIGIDPEFGRGKGSARSIPGFNVFAGIHACREFLDTCGGHEMAAGLSLDMQRYDEFVTSINVHAAGVMTADMLEPRSEHEGEIDPTSLSVALLDEWDELLEPFGLANPEPLFSSVSAQVGDLKRMGSAQQHLRLRVRSHGLPTAECVGWGLAEWADRVTLGDRLDILYSPQINEFNGRRSVQLVLKDLRAAKVAVQK